MTDKINIGVDSKKDMVDITVTFTRNSRVQAKAVVDAVAETLSRQGLVVTTVLGGGMHYLVRGEPVKIHDLYSAGDVLNARRTILSAIRASMNGIVPITTVGVRGRAVRELQDEGRVQIVDYREGSVLLREKHSVEHPFKSVD